MYFGFIYILEYNAVFISILMSLLIHLNYLFEKDHDRKQKNAQKLINQIVWRNNNGVKSDFLSRFILRNTFKWQESQNVTYWNLSWKIFHP